MIFKRLLKLPAWIDAKSHSLHVCDFLKYSFHMSSQIAWLNRFKVTRVAGMQNFSTKWFSNVFSNCPIEQMQSHISCMCVIFSNVSFHMSSQIACLNRCKVTRVADMQNFSIKWFSNVFSNRLIEQMQCHISCMCLIFSNVSFHVSSQNACLNRCKVTRVADMQNFSIKWFSIVVSNRLIEVTIVAKFFKYVTKTAACQIL